MSSLGAKLRKAAGSDGRVNISPDKLYAEKQVRETFDEDNIRELANSIASEGQLQPVTVHPRDKSGRHLIITGERRWRACKHLGRDVWIVEQRVKLDEPTTLIVQLIENVQRSDLTLMEQVRSVSALVTKHRVKQSEVARRMGKPKPTISKMVTVANMPPAVEALYDGNICTNLDTLAALTRLHEIAPSECDRFCINATKNGFAKRSAAEQLLRDNKLETGASSSPPREPKQTDAESVEAISGGSTLPKSLNDAQQPPPEASQSKEPTGMGWTAHDPRKLKLTCEVETSTGVRTGKIELNKIDSDETFCWVSFNDQPGEPERVLCNAVRLRGFKPN